MIDDRILHIRAEVAAQHRLAPAGAPTQQRSTPCSFNRSLHCYWAPVLETIGTSSDIVVAAIPQCGMYGHNRRGRRRAEARCARRAATERLQQQHVHRRGGSPGTPGRCGSCFTHDA